MCKIDLRKRCASSVVKTNVDVALVGGWPMSGWVSSLAIWLNWGFAFVLVVAMTKYVCSSSFISTKSSRDFIEDIIKMSNMDSVKWNFIIWFSSLDSLCAPLEIFKEIKSWIFKIFSIFPKRLKNKSFLVYRKILRFFGGFMGNFRFYPKS